MSWIVDILSLYPADLWRLSLRANDQDTAWRMFAYPVGGVTEQSSPQAGVAVASKDDQIEVAFRRVTDKLFGGVAGVGVQSNFNAFVALDALNFSTQLCEIHVRGIFFDRNFGHCFGKIGNCLAHPESPEFRVQSQVCATTRLRVPRRRGRRPSRRNPLEVCHTSLSLPFTSSTLMTPKADILRW